MNSNPKSVQQKRVGIFSIRSAQLFGYLPLQVKQTNSNPYFHEFYTESKSLLTCVTALFFLAFSILLMLYEGLLSILFRLISTPEFDAGVYTIWAFFDLGIGIFVRIFVMLRRKEIETLWREHTFAFRKSWGATTINNDLSKVKNELELIGKTSMKTMLICGIGGGIYFCRQFITLFTTPVMKNLLGIIFNLSMVDVCVEALYICYLLSQSQWLLFLIKVQISSFNGLLHRIKILTELSKQSVSNIELSLRICRCRSLEKHELQGIGNKYQEELQDIFKTFLLAESVIEIFNGLYSIPLILDIIRTYAAVGVRIYFILVFSSYKSAIDFIVLGIYIFVVLYYFLTLCIEASKLERLSKSFAFQLGMIDVAVLSSDTVFKASMMATRLNTNPLIIGRWIPINLNLFISIIGTTITYFAVTLQFRVSNAIGTAT